MIKMVFYLGARDEQRMANVHELITGTFKRNTILTYTHRGSESRKAYLILVLTPEDIKLIYDLFIEAGITIKTVTADYDTTRTFSVGVYSQHEFVKAISTITI